MKLTPVIESAQDYTFIPRRIPLLATRPLAQILEEPFVAPPPAAVTRTPPAVDYRAREIASSRAIKRLLFRYLRR